jgi:cyclopropane fatty-acyl-phospholipid synthase-like methyltransferase
MSLLLCTVGQDNLPVLLEKAHGALPAGGTLIVHDFMVEDDKTGPPDAALWFLTCMFNCPEAVVLTPNLVRGLAERAGFEITEARDLIPGLTKVIVARKP